MIIINDDDEELIVHRFPVALSDLEMLQQTLRKADCFCPSFMEEDPYNARLYLEQSCRFRTDTTFYLDRNLFTHVLDLVDGVETSERNRLAATVMAFIGCAESYVSAEAALCEGHD